MPKNRNEKIKIYVVTVLTLVLAVLGYYRFLHKESTVVANVKPDRITPPVGFDVPQVKIKDPVPKAGSYPAGDKEPGRAFLRDIFAPVKPLLKKVLQPAEPTTSKPAPSLTLRGTIVGGERPIAIINDQFLRQGDQIGEFRVVNIGNKEVVLGSDTKTLVLQLKNHE
jgi:hypothetical protein